jgi:hypothetical protein
VPRDLGQLRSQADEIANANLSKCFAVLFRIAVPLKHLRGALWLQPSHYIHQPGLNVSRDMACDRMRRDLSQGIKFNVA